MASNKLLLNPSKTEFLLLGTPQQLKKFDGLKSLKLGDSVVELADASRNLGVVFNSTMSLNGHCRFSPLFCCFLSDCSLCLSVSLSRLWAHTLCLDLYSIWLTSGSVLESLLYILYAADLSSILTLRGVLASQYSNDT